MTTTIVYSDTADGTIDSNDSDYSTARTGSSLSILSSSVHLVAEQNPPGANYIIREGFVSFDIGSAGIPSGDSITDVDLTLYQIFAAVPYAITVEARVDDWGSSLTTADWVAGADLSGLTLVASNDVNTANDSSLVTFTPSGSNLIDDVEANRAGFARYVIALDTLRTGSTPSSREVVQHSSADETGTTQDPRLVIEHSVAASGIFERRVSGAWTAVTVERRVSGAWTASGLERITVP